MAKKNCGDGYMHRSMGGKVKGYAMGGAAKVRKGVATKSGAPKAAPSRTKGR